MSNPRIDCLREELQREIIKTERVLDQADDQCDIGELVHCLQVYQTELEMQNQALEESNHDNETLRLYYSFLFKSLPLPCLVIDQRLYVRDSNQAAYALLSGLSNRKDSPPCLYNMFSGHQIHTLMDAMTRSRETQQVCHINLEFFQEGERAIYRGHIKSVRREDDDSTLLLLEDVTANALLARQKDLFLDVVENSQDLLIACDLKSNVLAYSSGLNELLVEDIGSDLPGLLPNLPKPLSQLISSYIEDGVYQREKIEESIEIESRKHHDSSNFIIRGFPIFDRGAIDGAGFILRDVTKTRAQDQELKLALKIFNEGQQAILVTDRKFKVIQVNRAFESITGYREQDVRGKTASFLVNRDLNKSQYRQFWKSIRSQGSWEGELWNKRKDGSLYPEWLCVSAYESKKSGTTHYIVTFRDISQQKENERRIEHLAFYDPLTGCGNRRLLEKVIGINCDSKDLQSFTVFFFDLDLFKNVNDIHGHDVGDELLKAVCNRLKNMIKNTDYLFRLGGDEFLILMNGLPTSEVGTKASSLIRACQSPFYIQKLQLNISVSIGIVRYPRDGEDFNTLLKHADLAMYKVKESGRSNYQFFDPAMLSIMSRKVQLEQRLRAALGNHEMHVVYMPIHDVATGALNGAEMLLRWVSPELGEVSPEEFIPVAEKSHLINGLTSYIAKQCIESVQDLKRSGVEDFRFSLNLSTIDIADHKYFTRLLDQLVAAEVEDYVTMEITESSLINNLQAATSRLRMLHNKGFKISVDDFGTGYSSLSYLVNFPIHEIKIDRSFVATLPNSPVNASVCKAVIALARAIKCTSVAEGVETEAQRQWLIDQGCDYCQGYLYGQPMSYKAMKGQIMEATH